MTPAKQVETSALQAILYQALGEPLGLIVRSSDPHVARQRLYAARVATGDPSLKVLQIRFSPWDAQELVIVKGPGKESAEEMGL